MIEPIMYFGIGFLVAALLGLMFVPLVHNRAVRLTMRRLEAATPLSIAEIRADKDQLRAEFAMSTRRLELSVEQMKAKTTTQLAELGKKTDAINQLRKELGEKTATIFALEARDKTIRDQLRATEEEFTLKTSSLREAESDLAQKESELSKLLAELGERSITADSQRVELAALRTQVEAMKASVSDYERAVKETEYRLGRERNDADAASKELTDARSKVENLASRTAQLERQLVVQTTEAEILGRRVQELETRLGDQGRLLAEREYEVDRLRSEIEASRKTESDLRAELASSTGHTSAAAEKFRTEISSLDAQLGVATEDRSKLLREISTMKRDAEATWAAERVENALLRERINDVAAEVARLTAALEGPGSAIETILATEPPRPRAVVNGTPGVNGSKGESGPAKITDPQEDSRGSLADRIRALQTRASRVASNN
jgi:chromosome segregation ATPase